ncbi:AMP-binding protein [Rhodococcus sp. C26F]
MTQPSTLPGPATHSTLDLSPGPTAGTLVLRVLRRYPNRIAFTDATKQLSYAGAADLIGRFQHVLSAHGLRRGDRVAFLSGNSAEAWCLSVAAHASGMVVSWLHPMGSLPDHLFQLADLDAAACIVDLTRHVERAHQLAEQAGDVPVFGFGSTDVGPDLLAEAGKVGATSAHDLARPEDIAIINYTGGTTGRPKGAVRRHTGFAHQMLIGSLLDFEIPFDARYLAVAPITHVTGTKVLPVLSRGGTVHLEDGFDPQRVLDVIARERISVSLMVPTMIYSLLDHPDLDRTDLSSLELLLYGASPMSGSRLDEGIDRLGPVFSQLYGQTECYPISVLRRGEHADPELRGSCGIPISTVHTTLLDAEGNTVPDGESGELCVRGPSVMDEYWRRPELTEEAFRHGWLHTGDVARRIGEHGHLAIVDRTKDLIISGGFNVYPREVEDALTSHDAVSAAAVFGVADERWGEAVTAVVVLRPDARVSPDELRTHVRSLKGPVQTPKSVRIVDTMPSTAVGKIDKRALSQQWLSS